MIWKRPADDAPPPPWKARVERARDLIRRHARDPVTEARLDSIESALEQASADRARLAAAVVELEPDRVARELKEALRTRPDPTGPDSPAIATLRRRYESVHALENRLESLDARIDTTLVDLEAYAAAVVETSFRAGGGAEILAAQLEALNADAAALAAAHDELSSL